MSKKTPYHPLNVAFRKGSPAEELFRQRTISNAAVATDVFKTTPGHDLHFHGGKTISGLHFMNFYVGADAWSQSDMANIDKNLAAAMSDVGLNNVMQQYFPASITSSFDGSHPLPGPAPATFSAADVEALVRSLAAAGKFSGHDLPNTVFNFMLPPGTVLNDNETPSQASTDEDEGKKNKNVPNDDRADSLNGLGGYHGSVHLSDGSTVYYAVGVFSQVKPDGSQNGIPVFDQPWKNVVATFYHELNEARTDVDVDDAISAGNSPTANAFLGWTSKQGEECGDFPVFEAGNNLKQVFQEVPLQSGGGTVPVQFQYSNAVHGPQGPQHAPVKKAKH